MTVNVYHKHSVVKEKAPDAKQIELGEVGINANQDSPALYIKDSADQVRKVGGDIVAIEEELKRLDFVISQLQDVIDVLDNFDGSGLQKLIKSLAALEAQVLLLAQHNVDQDKQIAEIENNINEIAKNVADLQEAVVKHKINIEQNEKRIDVLETVDVVAVGDGIKVEQTDTYKWSVSLDWDFINTHVAQMISDALVPYALKDISTNTPELDDA